MGDLKFTRGMQGIDCFTGKLELPRLRLIFSISERGSRFRGKIEDMRLEVLSLVWRLDCLSCVLTVLSTILIGRRCWTGWVLAAVNSLIICVIGLRTGQLGLIPANLFCIVLYAVNLRTWRKAEFSWTPRLDEATVENRR